jgi:hypothetical protein
MPDGVQEDPRDEEDLLRPGTHNHGFLATTLPFFQM